MAFSQISEESIMVRSKDCDIQGTLTVPDGNTSVVVLIVPNSGATDRDGNRGILVPNSYKMYSQALAMNNIASVRYDKRGVGASRMKNFDQSEIRFSMYVEDVKSWVRELKKRYSKVVVAGHFEGALVGLAAISEGSRADAFISIGGPGRKFDAILKENAAKYPQQYLRAMSNVIIDSMSKGKVVPNVHIYLKGTFNPSIQPYLISMFSYDPIELIKEVTIPMLLVHGTTDLKLAGADVLRLYSANRKAKVEVIQGMNHVLKYCPTKDKDIQDATYVSPAYYIHPQLVVSTVKFIETL